MISTDQELPNEDDSVLNTSSENLNTSRVETKLKEFSATTSDIPEFGWSAYAERINGRFAMIGFIIILLIEALSQDAFLRWAGIFS